MEAGGLFTPGFAGGQFDWWVGQIADDATWRDNIASGKHESPSQIPGWGRRYKVRIIGYHDKQEETVPSDQLAWAQVMYPITAGGGQSSSFQTPNLRQGMFVFGFFMDGQDMQVPVIMGVLGNNAQTALGKQIGTTESNFAPTSGYAESNKGPTDPNRTSPDNDLVTVKPKSQAQKNDTDSPPPNAKLNKYGLDPSKPLTSEQLADAKRARAEADARGLTGQQKEDFVMKSVADGIAARKESAESPASPVQPGAQKENADAVHQQSVSDVKKNNRQIRKIPLADPYDAVTSAMKNIQLVLNNLMNDIDNILQTALSYVDAASNVLDDIESLVARASEKLSKYMKPLMDKVMEFIIKTVQAAMAPLSNLTFPNQRNMIGDLQEQTTKLVTCLFEKIIDGLVSQAAGMLTNGIGLSDPNGLGGFIEAVDPRTATSASYATDGSSLSSTAAKVPMCYGEALAGNLIGANKESITGVVDEVIESVGGFMETITAEIEAVSSGLTAAAGAVPSIDGIVGDIASALDFKNIQFAVFGCDFDPTPSVSDLYTFAAGSASEEAPQQPNTSEVSESASNNSAAPQEQAPKNYATPARDTPDTDLAARITAEENALADIPADQNPDPASNTVRRDDIDQALEDSRNQVPVQDGDLDLL